MEKWHFSSWFSSWLRIPKFFWHTHMHIAFRKILDGLHKRGFPIDPRKGEALLRSKPRSWLEADIPSVEVQRGSRFMEGVRNQMWRSQQRFKREVHRKPWTFAFWVAWITGKYMRWMCWRESERWECMNMGYTTNCHQFVAIFHGTMMIHQHIYGWHFSWQTAWSPAKIDNQQQQHVSWVVTNTTTSTPKQ